MSPIGRVPLRPMIVPGPVWRRHRRFLVPDPSGEVVDPFRVLDATTGRQYPWDIWPPGSTTIGVPTTWACLRRGWTGHVYYLVPAPDRAGHPDGGPAWAGHGILSRALAWLRCRLI